MTAIALIQTGGTIDKEYPRAHRGYAFEIGKSAAKDILSHIDCPHKFTYYSAFKKDSLDILDADLKILKKLIDSISEEKIIITHGTDSLLETATYLQKHIQNKTILLTGSMRPAAFRETDAHFNLGMAMAAVQLYPHGIYIAIHGIVAETQNLIRNPSTKIYEIK